MKLCITFAIVFLFSMSFENYSQEKSKSSFKMIDTLKHAYIGVDACAPCHKTEKQGKQLDIWKESKHSKAYQTLLTERADSISNALNFGPKAIESEQCLKCHVTGYNIDKKFKQAKFKMEDGVQCETCHGPGEHYKPMSIMKDREKSVMNGLIIHEDLANFCIGCHNEESPTFKGFDLEKQWAEIKHNVPNKEK